MRKFLIICCSVSWLLGAAALAGETTKVTAADGQPVLVITGASYAADWKRPPLPGFTVVNRGKGGDETHQVLARFDAEVLAARPAVVLIWGHINNIHRAPPAGVETAKERAKSDYREMVARARRQGVEVILATEVTLSEAVGLRNRLAAIVGRLRGKQGYSARINAHVRELNEWLRGYAKQEGLRLLDCEKLFDDGEGFRKVEFSSDDGTHISASGYAALTRYAQSQLSRG